MSWHFSKALIQDYGNSRSLPALEAEYLEANCLDGEQSLPWNSTPFAPDDSCSDKMKGTLHRTPYGTMYVPSTDDRGMELLTCFRRAFPAKTSVQPARVLGSTESDPAFTSKWNGLLAKFDPASFGLKTAQISLITGLHESCVDLPRWGTMLDGELSVLPIPVRPIRGSDSGLLPTPMASDNRDRGSTRNPSIQRRMRIGKQIGLSMLFEKEPCPSCVEAMMGWPVGWTDSRPLATDKFRQWLQQHSASSQVNEP